MMKPSLHKTPSFPTSTPRQYTSQTTKYLQNIHSNVKKLDFYNTKIMKQQHKQSRPSKSPSKQQGNPSQYSNQTSDPQLKQAGNTPSTSSSCSSSHSIQYEKRQPPRSFHEGNVASQVQQIVEINRKEGVLNNIPEFQNGQVQHEISHTSIQQSKTTSRQQIQKESQTKLEGTSTQQVRQIKLVNKGQQLQELQNKSNTEFNREIEITGLSSNQQRYNERKNNQQQDQGRQQGQSKNNQESQMAQDLQQFSSKQIRHDSMHSGSNNNNNNQNILELPITPQLYTDLQLIKGREKRALYSEWSSSERLTKWEEKNLSSHTLIERVIYESATTTPRASQNPRSNSISRQSTSRSRDFTSQIQTIPGNQTSRELIEKSLTPEPKKIHPLNILIHTSNIMTDREKTTYVNDENNCESARGADSKRNNTLNNLTSRGQIPVIQLQISSKNSLHHSRKNSVSQGKSRFDSMYKEDYATKTSIQDLYLQKQQETAILQKRQAQKCNGCGIQSKENILTCQINSAANGFQLSQEKSTLEQQQEKTENKLKVTINKNNNSINNKDIEMKHRTSNSSHVSLSCIPQTTTFDLQLFQNYSQKFNEVSQNKKSVSGQESFLCQ